MTKRLSIIILLLPFIVISNVYSEIIIIANKDVPKNELSRTELKDIFLGKIKMWDDNYSLNISIRTNSVIFKEFTLEYMNCTPSFFISQWKTLIFTGRAVFPKRFNSREKIIAYVASTRGAIGYIESSSGLENVKIIKIK